MRVRLAALLIAALLVVSGCLSAPTPATPTESSRPDATPANPTPGGTTPGEGTPPETETASGGTPTDATPEPTVTARPDPASDRLGWEGGLWYNESIAVDRSEGLNDTELALVVNRSMARVERIREIEFERSVPVEVISREEYRDRTSARNTSRRNRLHQNVKWEAMFMLGEDEPAIQTRQSNLGATVAGYYSPARNRIVIVSEGGSSPNMDELTLGHELVHALQDQVFNTSRYESPTRELHNARDGIIEGDANYVQRLYRRNCGDDWECLLPRPSGGGGGSAASIHWGMYLVTYQPYSDGPPFVKRIRARSGWAGVNDVYANPPASTEQTIHPEKYPNDVPVNRSFTDTSGEGWHVLELRGGIDYASFGEAGLATMLFYPFYDSGRTAAPIITPQQFFNFTPDGSLSRTDPIDYGNPYTTGWDGDWLYPYVNDSSFATNETGYVWKTVWDSRGDARQFVEGYRALLDYYGATPVEGRDRTYRIAEPSPYADAFRLIVEGSTVTIVNAPTVDDLGEVRANAGPG